MIANNTLHNSPVTIADIRRVYDIFGPPVPVLQGKSKRQKPDPVSNTTLARIPRKLYNNIRKVTLSMAFLSVNSVPFFVAKSRKIEYGTISAVDNRTKETMIDIAVKVVKKYAARGLIAHEIMADNEFKPITDAVAPAFVNLTAASEHVGDIEVFLSVIQERARCIHHALPYGLCWPRVMMAGLMEYIMAMKNAFPAKVGASTTMSRPPLSMDGDPSMHPSLLFHLAPTFI